jgi:hypothetical protein
MNTHVIYEYESRCPSVLVLGCAEAANADDAEGAYGSI